MKKILALTLFATALSGAGCAPQPTTAASAESGGEVYTGSRIPRKGAEGSSVQTIDGTTYKQEIESGGAPQVSPRARAARSHSTDGPPRPRRAGGMNRSPLSVFDKTLPG
jgi:hypothetical protein